MTTLLESLGVTDIKEAPNPYTAVGSPIQPVHRLIEFIPERDHLTIPTMGSPTLSPDRKYYSMQVGDALILPREIARRAFASPYGFTFMMCFGWDPIADGAQYGTFECASDAGDDSVYGNAARAGEDKLVATSCGLAWNPDEYQGRQHDANAATGSHITSLRYDRLGDIPSRTRTGLDGSILLDERLNAYGPNEPYSADVLNGQVAFYGTSHFYIGSNVPFNGKTVPRVGYFALWDIPLTDEEWRLAMLFGLANYPV